MKIKAIWGKGMSFVCENELGNSIKLEQPEGVSPMEAVLMALAGCTGMDVASILKKMKIEPEEFIIFIEAERKEEHPRVFRRISLVYRFKGGNIKAENVQRAVELSLEKYCSVKAMLEKTAKIEYRYEIVN
ncbi:MAG: OsmC family protein [bacterium]